MQKDFAGWSQIQEKTDRKPRLDTVYKERDVWWTAIGQNIGDEENGKSADYSRPVLVIKRFNHTVFWGIPLSSRYKSGIYYYPVFMNGWSTPSTALLSQMRIFDTKRFIRKLGVINMSDQLVIRKRLRKFLI